MLSRPAVVALAVVLALSLGVAALAQTPSPSTTAATTPTPPPAATLWPAPLGLNVLRISVFHDASRPVGPRLKALVRWGALAGFTGSDELERAEIPYRSNDARVYTRIALPPQLAAVAGGLRFEEPIDPERTQCYRVRTLLNGEAGRYSVEVCTAAPLSDLPDVGGPGWEASIRRPLRTVPTSLPQRGSDGSPFRDSTDSMRSSERT